MEDLLVPIRTSKTKRPAVEDISVKKTPGISKKIAEPSQVLQILKNEPDFDDFQNAIKYLKSIRELPSSLHIPSPTTTQIINSLIQDVIPSYWPQLNQGVSSKRFLEEVLQCINGTPALGAILTRLRALIQESNSGNTKHGKSSYLETQFECLFGLLSGMMHGDEVLVSAWNDLEASDQTQTRKELIWKELVQVLTSGRIPSTVSAAEASAAKVYSYDSKLWLAHGEKYSLWLARNIAIMASRAKRERSQMDASGPVLAKSLSLGYSSALVKELMLTISRDDANGFAVFDRILFCLRPYEVRSLFLSIIRLLDKRMPPVDFGQAKPLLTAAFPSQTAGLLKALSSSNEVLSDFLIDIISKPESYSGIVSPVFLQAVVAAVSHDKIRMTGLLETALRKFCDELAINHSSVQHQEQNAMLLLLVAGYFTRNNASRLKTVAKSSEFMNSITKHLACNSNRVRWLGMLVATGISGVVDQGDGRLNFDDKSLKSDEAKWYLNLLKDQMQITASFSMRVLFGEVLESEKAGALIAVDKRQKTHNQKESQNRTENKTSNSARIIEIVDDDDDMVPYAKPDSDPEDEDEDPTLIDRNKPKAPVYIRDLMVGLREQENYDKHYIALKEAASLIRRKSGYGKEVLDHEEELTSLLLNLQDNFELEEFTSLRQAALIALLLASPASTAQRYARAAFSGDFSLQQRLAILAALGIGSRELAGHKDDNEPETSTFPSKQLPPHLAAMYADPATNLTRIASRVEQSLVRPLAMHAADELAGPNALKVRTFSTRMSVARTKKRPEANKLAGIVVDSFFTPLTSGWWMTRSSSSHGMTSMPEFVSTFLRTLALILDASGPWTLALPRITSDFWVLLLSVRSRALANREYDVLESLLLGLLVLLEVNGEMKEQLAREHAKELVETQEWTRLILERVDGSDVQGAKIHGLAAAVVFRCGEVVEKWQRLMVGDLIGI